MKKNRFTTPSKSKKTAKVSGHPQTEFDAILNSIPDVIIRFNLDGKVVWWNKNLEDVVLVSKEKLANYLFSDLFNSYNGESIEYIINETDIYGYTEVDARLTTIEGDKRYHLKSTLVTGSPAKEILIVGRDIDERAHMADALRQSQTQLQKLIDALPFFVFLTSTEDEYILANKRFCEFVNLPLEKIKGFESKDIFKENLTECFTRDNTKILSEKSSIHYETAVELNRNNISLSVDKFPLFDEANNIYAICGVIEDVTAQYQLQRQLQQTQKMEAIGQLTGGIAHDFNNVLASIMGYTGLAKRQITKYEDETIEGYLTQINRAGERARDLVQQLLAFSRGDVGGLQVLEPEPLAKEAIKMLVSLIPSSISLNLKIRNNNLKHFIEVDPVQFNQSVMNLVINAKDAIVDGTGEINVSLEYLPNVKGICDSCHNPFSGKYIQLTVSDNGIGISNEIMGRVFDPFFTTKEVGKGSGMGLSMLHGIVHGSGGHIVIKSNNPHSRRGTTIQIYYPEIKSNAVEEKHTEYVISKSLNQNKGKRILVIDDEPLITQYLTDLLNDEDYKVTSFNDSIQGLDYFKKHNQKIDLIITDQTMPELTGLELAININESGYKLPIILCTGYSDFAKETMDIDHGIDVFMNKPFNDDLLLNQISRLLNLYKE